MCLENQLSLCPCLHSSVTLISTMLGVTLLRPWRVFLPDPVAACLRLSPDRLQFFRYDSLSLSCEGQNPSTSGWKVQKKTSEGRVRPCPTTDSTCVISKAYPMDSGVYFCQSEGGQTSNAANVTVTGTCTATGEEVDSSRTLSESHRPNSSGGGGCVADRSVLLESPALPVSEGAAVTLRCRNKLHSSGPTFHFYRDGSKVHSSSDGEMTFPHTSKSDQGLYKCSTAGGEESESSWLAVQGDALERTSKLIFIQKCPPKFVVTKQKIGKNEKKSG